MEYLTPPEEWAPSIRAGVNWFISLAPLISYGTTIKSISNRRDSAGFSLDICATMLMASFLRIIYYFSEPYEFSLFRQCIVMIFIQSALLHVALKYRNDYSSEILDDYPNLMASLKEVIDPLLEESPLFNDLSSDYQVQKFTNLYIEFLLQSLKAVLICVIRTFFHVIKFFDGYYKRPFLFWQWEDTMAYWRFLLGMTVSVVSLSAFFRDNYLFSTIIGALSFLIESLLPLPQILLIQRMQSVRNFKSILLLSWLGGDFTKISYLIFGAENVSNIFICAAVFQMSLNLIITWQFFHYKNEPVLDTVERGDPSPNISHPVPQRAYFRERSFTVI